MSSRLVFATLALAAAGQSIGEQRPVIGAVAVDNIGYPVSLDQSNNVAFVGSVSGNWSELQIVNVSGNTPELLASLELVEEIGSMTAIARSGDKLYMTLTGEEDSYLAVADVTSLEAPLLDSLVDLGTSFAPTSIAYNNNHVYITVPDSVSSTLLIYDVSSSTPSPAVPVSLPCPLEYCTVSNSVLYLACGEFYWPATLTTPSSPTFGDSRPVQGLARALATYQDSIFIASVDGDNNGTSYLDHYNTVNNEYVATYSFPANDVRSLTVAPVNGTNYAFLACGSQGLRIMNLEAENKDDALTGYVPVTSETSGQVAVQDDYLYAADSPNRFIIVDTLDIVSNDDDDDGPSAAVIAVAVIVPVACIAGLAGGYFYYKSKTAVAGSYSSMA